MPKEQEPELDPEIENMISEGGPAIHPDAQPAEKKPDTSKDKPKYPRPAPLPLHEGVKKPEKHGGKK